MKDKSRIRIPPIFILIVILTLFFSLDLQVKSEEQQDSSNFSGCQKFILLIIDYQSLFCPLCMEIFQKFCAQLHSSGQERYALGVLIFQVSDDDEDREKVEKIIEKQLKGLIIGSHIRFPFLCDKSHIFEGIALEGAAIILFDRSRKLLKKYTLPLTIKEKEEVFSF